MRIMRIMLVSRVYPTHRPGGMPHVCKDRAVELARQCHDVHVVTTSCSKTADKTLPGITMVEEGVTVHYTSSPAHKWSPEFSVECLRLWKELKPDILHSDSFDRENWWWRGMPMSVTMHGFTFGAWLTDWNEHRAYGNPLPPFPAAEAAAEADMLRSAKTVLAVSRWEHRMLRDQYGLQPRLVYNPIAPAFFQQPPTGVERRVFLCVAVSQGGRRGFAVAKRAATLAGVRLVTAQGLSRERMPAMYDQAKALVLPTAFAQGYDLAVAEGRSRGCPAIMTATGSYLEEAEWWDKLVPIGDVGAVADAMSTPFTEAENIGESRHVPRIHALNWLDAVVG